MDSEITETDQVYEFVPARLGESFEGNRFPNTPDIQLSVFGHYNWTRLGLGQLETSLGVVYIGEREGNSGNTLTLPDYTIVDAGARYRLANGFSVSLFIDNLFDETAYTAMQDSGDRVDQISVSDRRLVRAGLRYDF